MNQRFSIGVVVSLLFSLPAIAAQVPRPQPRIPASSWAPLLKAHPRLQGGKAFLTDLAKAKAQQYQLVKSQSGLQFAGVVHAVEGLPAEKIQPFIEAAMKNVARGPANVHQDTWIWLCEVTDTFDYFHDQIPAEQRAKMIEWMNAHLEKYTDDEGAFHNSTPTKIRCYLRIAYATWGENPRAREFRDYAIIKLYEGRMVPPLVKFGAGGGWTEAGWYGRTSLWALVEALELARRFEGYDGFAKAPQFFYQRLAYELHESYPGLWLYGSEHYAVEGDGSNLYGGTTEYPRHARTLLAQYFRGSELARYTAARRRKGSNPQAVLVDFLYEEPADAPLDLAAFPLAHIATGVGRVYARSDWKADATWLRFECGPWFTAHQHYEVGNFEIFRHESLAADSGEYSDWGGPHARNWLIRTIAHNCILVSMPGEEWTRLRDGSPRAEGNDGGQAKKWEWGWQTLDQWEKAGNVTDRGHIAAYHNQPEFLYVAADCTPAYSPLKLKQWTRQIVFLRPGTFIILDRVASTKPEYEKTWLLHCRPEPQLAGSKATIADGKGRLAVQTLLPEKARLQAVEGYTYGGQTYEPRKSGLSEVAPRWRIEVKPAVPAAEDLFLHVLFTGPEEPATLLRNGRGIGARIGKAQVLFNPDLSAAVTIDGKTTPIRAELQLNRWEE